MREKVAFTNPLLILLPYLYSAGMMKKTLPNFDFMRKIYEIVTKHIVFFSDSRIEEEEEAGSGWQNCLGSSRRYMIWLEFLSRAIKEKVDFFRVDRLDGVFKVLPSGIY